MPRRPRIQYPGAIYHVMSRGNRKDDVFEDDRDREQFLRIIEEATERYELRPLAYCLMRNHYHAVVHTPLGNIAKGMQHVNGGFTQWSNKHHRHTGHLLEGRYVAIIVDDMAYLRDLCRYVVLNPVKARLVTHAAKWRWSSYRATAGLCDCPAFLKIDWIDYAFGGPTREAAEQRYRQFVDEELEAEEIDAEAPNFGASNFNGMPLVYPIATRPPLECVFAERLLSRRLRNDAIREAHCKFGYTLVEIAKYLQLDRSTPGKVLRNL